MRFALFPNIFIAKKKTPIYNFLFFLRCERQLMCWRRQTKAPRTNSESMRRQIGFPLFTQHPTNRAAGANRKKHKPSSRDCTLRLPRCISLFLGDAEISRSRRCGRDKTCSTMRFAVQHSQLLRAIQQAERVRCWMLC